MLSLLLAIVLALLTVAVMTACGDEEETPSPNSSTTTPPTTSSSTDSGNTDKPDDGDNDTEGQKSSYVIKITDKDLLENTGGIVQGMSGSPIVQNGLLVGAITHVLVDNPARGYGIYASTMLYNVEKYRTE